MSMAEAPRMRKRVFLESKDLRRYILTKAYKSATRPGSNIPIEHVRSLHDEFAARASLLRIPEEHKWLIKLTRAFKEAMDQITPTDKVTTYHTVTDTFEENKDAFLACNVEDSNLSVRKIIVPSQPPLNAAGQRSIN